VISGNNGDCDDCGSVVYVAKVKKKIRIGELKYKERLWF